MKYIYNDSQLVAEGDGSKITKVYTNDNVGVLGMTRYVYDDLRPKEAIGNQCSTHLSAKKYDYLKSYFYDGATLKNKQQLYYLFDDLGSVVMITNHQGLPTQYYQYDAWGNITNASNDPINGLSFVGRYGGFKDWDTGLTYFWHRWYDGELGRWISRDPIENLNYSSGCPKTKINNVILTNPYNYAINSPTKLIDPSGLFDVDVSGNHSTSSISILNLEETVNRYNYCGKNYSEKHMHLSWKDEISFELPALNPTDQCCKNHDICSVDVLNRIYNKKQPVSVCNKSKSIDDCNREAKDCFYNAKGGGPYAWLAGTIFLWPHLGNPAVATY